MNYIFIAITLLGTVIGQLILKAGSKTLYFPQAFSANELVKLVYKNFTNWYFLSSIFFAAIAAFSWALAVQKFKLSFAYPFMSLSFVLVFFASYFLFGENFGIYQLLGIILIVAGLCVLSIGIH